MKRVHTISFTAGAGARGQLTRGNLNLDKGKVMKAMRCKFTVPLNNTSGGAVTLSDAEKQALLADFLFAVSYGPDGKFKPFDNVDGARIHREARFAFGSEIEGYTDTSTGLQRSLPNSATTNVVFYMPIPLGWLWFLEPSDSRLLGMGRTQSKSVQVEISMTSTAVRAGVVASGTVQIELFPQTESCKGDPWGAVPYWRQNDTANDEIEGPEGLPLRIVERTAVHASSSLTSINVKVDGEIIHETINPQDSITEYNDLALATASGSLTDRETVLYAVGPSPGATLADLPTGKPYVKQVVKNLSTFAAGYLYLPTISADDVKAALQYATSSSRPKELKASSLRVVRGGRGGNRLDSMLGFILLDRDDREFEQFPGLVLAPGESEPRIQVPDGLADRVKRTVAAHDAAGESKAAAEVVKQLASAVPGAVSSARGLGKGGSPIFERIASSVK